MEQVGILLLFAVLAIGKWFLDRASSEKEESRQPHRDANAEEEKMRRFMEALGQPSDKPSSRPIPAQRPHAWEPPRPQQPPPQQPKPAPKKARPAPPPVQSAPMREPAPALAVQRPISWNRALTEQKPALIDSLDLRTPDALQRAVVLREILGVPKGLQSS